MGDLDYRRVFAATDDPLLVCDADSGRVVDANERVCTLLAAERSTLTDRRSTSGSSPLATRRDRSTCSAPATPEPTV